MIAYCWQGTFKWKFRWVVEEIENRFSELLMKFFNTIQLIVVVVNGAIDRSLREFVSCPSECRRRRYGRIYQAIEAITKSNRVISVNVKVLRVKPFGLQKSDFLHYWSAASRYVNEKCDIGKLPPVPLSESPYVVDVNRYDRVR